MIIEVNGHKQQNNHLGGDDLNVYVPGRKRCGDLTGAAPLSCVHQVVTPEDIRHFFEQQQSRKRRRANAGQYYCSWRGPAPSAPLPTVSPSHIPKHLSLLDFLFFFISLCVPCRLFCTGKSFFGVCEPWWRSDKVCFVVLAPPQHIYNFIKSLQVTEGN